VWYHDGMSTKKKTPAAPKAIKSANKSRKITSRAVVFTTGADVKTALLIVSVTINLFVLCLWVALQVTSYYDQALVNFFIHR
jgi:hypothetical protein